MTDATIQITNVTEHQDGSATYTFEISDKAAEFLQNIGLEFVIYCGCYGIDLQDALDLIKQKGEESD